MYATTYSTNRLYEWIASIAMFGMGLGVIAAIAVGWGVAAVVVMLTDYGMTNSQVGILFTLLGALGMLALLANGRWRANGCYLRYLGCVARLFVWAHLFGGLVIIMLNTRQFYLVVIVWGAFCLGEVVSIVVALWDRQAYPAKASANARIT